MGNKDAGRALLDLDYGTYIENMGGSVQEMINTGVDFTNWAVIKYFKTLRDYAINRIKWRSDQVEQKELRLIEWFIFHYGYCAMVRPTCTRNNIKYKSPSLKVFQCIPTNINFRVGRSDKITLVRYQNQKGIIDSIYEEKDFTVFTDQYLYTERCVPFGFMTWEFACKLHELDLAFNANSHRNRMPFVFNNASAVVSKNGPKNIIGNRGVSISEIMRSAFGKNEQFVELPDNVVGENFMHEPQYVQNLMLEHLEAQKKIYEAFFEMIGLYTNRDKTGAYTVKALQQEGDESGDFRTKVLKTVREECAREACLKFGIDLSLEAVS